MNFITRHFNFADSELLLIVIINKFIIIIINFISWEELNLLKPKYLNPKNFYNRVLLLKLLDFLILKDFLSRDFRSFF